MATNQSNWLWDANVFGQQAPQSNGATAGVYPECGRQQERNWALENMLFGLENVIAPALTDIKNAMQLSTGQANISTVTDKLLLTGAADNLPTAKFNTFISDLAVVGATGYLSKISIYNLTTNASVTVNSNSTEGFLIEAGVALDLDRAGNTFYTIDNDPSNTTAQGTLGETIYIVYSVLVVNNP